MTRATRWLTAAAITALAISPAAAQQPAPTTPAPEPQQQQTQPATSTQPADHIKQAKMALDGIPKDAVKGPSAAKIAELRRHLTALEKANAKTWATNVAAIDKTITDLLADASLDADAKAKVGEVRTHVTAFAAVKSGTASTTPPASTPDPMSATAATGTTASSGTTATTPTTPTTGTMTETQATPPAGQPAAADPAVTRQHLSEARRVLAEITQMPEAAQLQGEARTQVAQLITNFNALITAESDWREKYAAVDQNMNTLLGTTAGAAVAGTTGSTSATGTTGTTGTAGTTGSTATTTTAGATITLDPAIKVKLEELRRHLNAFNAAAGGQKIPQ